MGTMTSFKLADEISRNLTALPVITIDFKIYFHSHALIITQAPTINTPLTYTLPFVWIPYITVLAIMVFSWKWKGKPSSTKLAWHDDVIKWKHFPRNWPFVRGIHRSPVNSPHKGQWLGALMFSLICVWINAWVNNREAGDLRSYLAHYDVTVMIKIG